jgi:hypothetical protein
MGMLTRPGNSAWFVCGSPAGPLPSDWSRLVNLQDLRIANTSLVGPLPSSWSGMTSLWRVELALNSLTGETEVTLVLS